MKVAVAIWEDRVSPVFDMAQRVRCFSVDGVGWEALGETDIALGIGKDRVTRLADLGVEVLICGAISRPLAQMVEDANIMLIAFVSGEVEELMRAFCRGRLPDPTFLMPGCCGKRRRSRSGRGRRGGSS